MTIGTTYGNARDVIGICKVINMSTTMMITNDRYYNIAVSQ